MFLSRLKLFLNPFDGRYEDLTRGNPALNLLKDLTAGLVVAMIAIPLAMGFAIASGLRPEQGIVGGAVAGLVGALFGGSKYQVYGPTAAFIPVLGALMSAHDHGFLVLVSIVAGVALWIMGLAGAGRVVKLVPHSIVVGFTIGIAFTIALSQVGEVLGLQAKLGYDFFDKLSGIVAHFGTMQLWAVLLAALTFAATQGLLKISPFLPGPLLALGLGVVLAQTWLSDAGLTLVATKFGEIPRQGLVFTPPAAWQWDAQFLKDVAYYATAIVFVAAIESLLCSRMADRLADNRGTPFHPDKELWGQGHVMVLVPLLNGFPHTGALARTATNIKLGAISPLAGIAKFGFKLLLAFYLARYLELVPMACIGGILLYVAKNMIKPSEIDEVKEMGRGHVWLTVYTALAVIATDFLRGVLSALVLYALWQLVARSLKKETPKDAPAPRQARSTLQQVVTTLAHARRPGHHDPVSGERRTWLSHIRLRSRVPRSAFVHPQASVIGPVVLGENVHIAAGSSVRADEGAPFYVGDDANVQDGVVIHALKDRHVLVAGAPWAVHIGKRVSLAHDALVHGPCSIGDDTFVGFKAVVHDSTVGDRCFIGIGAVVVGVEIPDGRFVPPGTIVDSPEKARALGPVTEAHEQFNEDVVEVNRGLASAYREHHGASRALVHRLRGARRDEHDVAPAPYGDRF